MKSRVSRASQLKKNVPPWLKKNMPVCGRCGKSLSNERSLARHLRKNLPCDLKCPVCEKKCETKYQFYRHRENAHPMVIDSESEESEEEESHVGFEIAKRPLFFNPEDEMIDSDDLKKLTPTETVPLDDFHELYLQMLKEANENDCEITIREIKIRPRKRTDHQRMQRVINSLQESAYMSSLQTLSSYQKLDHVAVTVLEKVHADRNSPGHHSICLADPSRKTTKIFSRNGTKVGWVLHQKDEALRKLNVHSTDLIAILLEHAVEKLQNASFIRNYKQKLAERRVFRSDRVPCVSMTDSKEYVIICLDQDYEKYENVYLNVENISYDDLFVPGDIDPECFEILRRFINERKDQIIDQLKTLIIDERHLIEFLKKSRQVCLQTHAPESYSPNSLKTLK